MDIEMIAGGFGLHKGCTVRLMRPGDGPFWVPEETGRELIAAGVARAVHPAEDSVPDTAQPARPVPMENRGTATEDMTLAELKKLGAKHGVKYKVGTSKADYIGQIKAKNSDMDPWTNDSPEDSPHSFVCDGEDVVDDL